jgi:hypothetical protein
MMIINNGFDLGQIVYLRTDKDQSARMVRQICVRSSGFIQYELMCGSNYSWHDELEISAEKDILKATTE